MDNIGLLAANIDALGLHHALRSELWWARRSQDSELREGILEPADVGGLEVALVLLVACAGHDVLVETKSLASGVVWLTGFLAPKIGTESGPADRDLAVGEAHLRSLETDGLRAGDVVDVVARVRAPSVNILGLDAADGIGAGSESMGVHELLFAEGASESTTEDTNSASVDGLVVSERVNALKDVLTDNTV